ncbi:synapsin-like, partial [Ctenocephalides felis]|uniref:synapsin-like n=1 Tax=Ctenocephalides felis TaxID=7515 RepID=UPI000E6E35F0
VTKGNRSRLVTESLPAIAYSGLNISRSGCGRICQPAEPPGPALSFSSFRNSFTNNVNYLKRRFSSGDLSSECDDGDAVVDPYTGQPIPPGAQPVPKMGQQAPPLQSQPMPSQPPNPNTAQAQQSGGELSLNLRGPPRGTSAPSSPAKSRESLLQRVQSLTGAARDQGASILGAAVQSATRPSFNKDRSFTLLVIDDQNTDWSKYFRGKKLHNDYDIRVEQAEFKELSLIASGEQGCTVSMAVYRSGTKVMRSFRPDFVLIRQNLRDASEDNRSLLLGLKYGGVPSVNSLSSIYNFQDRPWVFAHLMQLQRRLGRENFPLIEQTYYPNHREMSEKPFNESQLHFMKFRLNYVSTLNRTYANIK